MRYMARAMALAKISWQLRLTGRKQASAGLPGGSFFKRIRPLTAMPAVRPGLARENHLRAQVIPIEPDTRHPPTINIPGFHRHLNALVQHTLRQHCTRILTAGLANFRRINAMNTQLARLVTRIKPNPERVTIRDVRYGTRESADCVGRVCQQNH